MYTLYKTSERKKKTMYTLYTLSAMCWILGRVLHESSGCPSLAYIWAEAVSLCEESLWTSHSIRLIRYIGKQGDRAPEEKHGNTDCLSRSAARGGALVLGLVLDLHNSKQILMKFVSNVWFPLFIEFLHNTIKGIISSMDKLSSFPHSHQRVNAGYLAEGPNRGRSQYSSKCPHR